VFLRAEYRFEILGISTVIARSFAASLTRYCMKRCAADLVAASPDDCTYKMLKLSLLKKAKRDAGLKIVWDGKCRHPRRSSGLYLL
jgi:hypothetical protein